MTLCSVCLCKSCIVCACVCVCVCVCVCASLCCEAVNGVHTDFRSFQKLFKSFQIEVKCMMCTWCIRNNMDCPPIC